VPGMNHAGHFATALALCGLSACSSVLGPEDIRPDPDAPVQTSELRYALHRDQFRDVVTVPLTFTNASPEPVYFDHCGMWLEQRHGGRWRTAFQQPCPAAAVPAQRIDPGEVFETALTVQQPLDTDTYPRFQAPARSGVYRVIVQLYRTTRVVGEMAYVEAPLPPDRGRSNTFWLDFPTFRLSYLPTLPHTSAPTPPTVPDPPPCPCTGPTPAGA
jgi:hypothetical protein